VMLMRWVIVTPMSSNFSWLPQSLRVSLITPFSLYDLFFLRSL
jgi:hypothetical protein